MAVKFYPWTCKACGQSGRYRHLTDASPAQLAKAQSLAHAQRSPECHARGLAAQFVLATQVPAGLTPRERHLLLSVRVKRKIVADVMHDQRGHHPAPPERSGEAWDAWVAKVSMVRTGLRKQFKQTRTLRHGYAFT